MANSRNILTIATEKRIFLNLAVNLARSFNWWHPDTNIKFHIVTDLTDDIPEDLRNKIQIIYIPPGAFGKTFSPKLHLDKLVPEGQTIFIDSDCLIFGKLDKLFEIFKGHSVSVIGRYIKDGEWFGDIQKICENFNIPHIPKFNGGLYYLEKGEEATRTFTIARELEKSYDLIGFIRLRDCPNDEVLMALAMQLHSQQPIIDDGTIMSDPQACQGGYDIDVINGKRWLFNPPVSDPLHQKWYPFEKVSPLIVHFLGYYTDHYPYKREVYKLDKIIKNRSQNVTNLMAFSTIVLPSFIKTFVKQMFRPLYRSLFGIRKVKPSNRI